MLSHLATSPEEIPVTNNSALINKERLIVMLSEIAAEDDIFIFKNKISDLKTAISNEIEGNGLITSIEANDVISMRRDLLVLLTAQNCRNLTRSR
jgi:hypothetical protein